MNVWYRIVVCGVANLCVAATAADGAQPRRWTSTTGATIEAEFVKLDFRNSVTLRLKTGGEQIIPLAQFSPADIMYVKRATADYLPRDSSTTPAGPNFSAAAIPLDQLKSEPEGKHTPLPAKAANVIRGAEMNGETIDVRSEAEKKQFDFYRDVPADGGVLIGFDLSVGSSQGASDQGPLFRGLFPIFLTPKGKVRGARQGYDDEKKIHLEAKPGYAVGRIEMCGGLRIKAIKLTYMRLTPQGLDPNDAYQSPVCGAPSEDLLSPVGDGSLIVGIHGIGRRSGFVYTLGIVTLPTGP